MDTTLSDTERLLAESVEDSVRRRMEPLIARMPADEPCSREDILALNDVVADFGVFGARVPEDLGGSGLSQVMLGIVIERLPPFYAVSAIAHEATTFRFLSGATDELRARYLPELVAGTVVAGSAISEPEIGSDPARVRTQARIADGRVHLSGSKLWTTNGTVADLIVVLARNADTGELTRVLVDTRQTPVVGREVSMGGLRQGHLSELELDVTVPSENVLGRPVDARDTLTRAWLSNRPNMGLVACHIGTMALQAATRYATERQQFGRSLASFQLIQGILADTATDLQAGRLLCYHALSELDHGRRAAREASMAKMFCTEAGARAVTRCQEVFGAFGSSTEFPLDQWLRDVRMLTHPDGTRQIHQLIVGRDLTGVSAFG